MLITNVKVATLIQPSSLVDSYEYLKNEKGVEPRIVSHISFGFLVLFIGLNYNFSYEKDFNLKLGDKKIFDNYSLEFEDLQLKDLTNSCEQQTK